MIYQKIYIKYSTKLVRLDLVENERLGLCIYAHWATYTYDDSVILTTDERTDPRYRYKLGGGRIEKIIKTALSQNRVYYATNDVGAFVESYLCSLRKLTIY